MAYRRDWFTCEMCGKAKEDEDGWLLATRPRELRMFSISGWDERNATAPGIEHLCSAECASQWTLQECREILHLAAESAAWGLPEAAGVHHNNNM